MEIHRSSENGCVGQPCGPMIGFQSVRQNLSIGRGYSFNRSVTETQCYLERVAAGPTAAPGPGPRCRPVAAPPVRKNLPDPRPQYWGIFAAAGTLSAMHHTVRMASQDGSRPYRYKVPVFNLSTEMTQVSRLRLVNPGDFFASIMIGAR